MKRIMLATAAIGLFALAACDSAYQLQEVERLRVESAAQDYAARLDVTFVGCSGQDSDGDGYVTCDLADGTAIACSYGPEPGCKRKTAEAYGGIQGWDIRSATRLASVFHPSPDDPVPI